MVALVGVSITAAACSSSPSGLGVASISSSTTVPAGHGKQHRARGHGRGPLAFSLCMRHHGVPNFPEPGADGAIQITPSSGIDPGSTAFQKAMQTCQSIAGFKQPTAAQRQQALDRLLRYSSCMRSHGVPGFPDPTSLGGGIGLRLGPGVDPRSPQFQSAAQACQHVMAGPKGGGVAFRTRAAGPAPAGALSAR